MYDSLVLSIQFSDNTVLCLSYVYSGQMPLVSLDVLNILISSNIWSHIADDILGQQQFSFFSRWL